MPNLKLNTTSKLSYLQGIQYIVYGSILLYFGRDLFIPICFALLISFVLYPVCVWFERKGAGRMSAIIIAIVLLIILCLLIIALFVSQLLSFLNEWQSLKLKFNQLFDALRHFLIDVLGISEDRQREILASISDQAGGSLFKTLGNIISASVFSVFLLILVPIYVVLILFYRQHWMKLLGRLFPSETNGTLHEIIQLTIRAYYNFIKGMAIVYLIVGTLNSIGLLLLGVPHAILFGFIASILTFIPYVGIIAGSLLPITMAWITYDSVWYPIGIIGVFTFVQYLEANVIFPIAVSERLNINTLIMLLAIFSGGILWGMAGMILFVPMAGIAKIIADHNPKWKTISLILGTGKQ